MCKTVNMYKTVNLEKTVNMYEIVNSHIVRMQEDKEGKAGVRMRRVPASLSRFLHANPTKHSQQQRSLRRFPVRSRKLSQ